MSLVFFASHAHLDRDEDLRDFVARLRTAVRTQIGLPVEPREVGFFDETHIETGDDWEKVLAGALSRAKICVCLYSPTYKASVYCGKEYQVFVSRREKFLAEEQNKDKRARVVFPILWVRPSGPLPPVVSRFQYTDARLPPDYEKKGLRYLAMRPGKAQFKRIIEDLGAEIRDALDESELPPENGPLKFAEIKSAFHDAIYGFRLAVLHAEGAAWTPYPGSGSMRKLADSVAGELRVSWDDLPAADLVAAIRKAEREREAVLVVCEASALGADADRTALVEQLSRESIGNCALVLVWPRNAGNARERAAKLEAVLPDLVKRSASAKGRYDLLGVDSYGALKDEIERSFAQLRQALVADDPPVKADSQAIRDTAQSEGVSVERPALTGPGGRR